jgi:stage II sporulation protein D
MSQYGAYGQARAGRDYKTIVHHYYRHTELGKATGSIRVLLLASVPSVTFGGANQVGSKRISARQNYTAVRVGGRVVVRNSRGKRVARSSGVLRVLSPSGIVTVANKGASYRDVIELRPGLSGGVTAVNKAELEHYVRGVVPLESPASWPIEALKAQAVAARSYALAERRGGVFDVYDTTASQVYGGFSAEQQSTNRAVAKTNGQVLRYQGKVITAYFHSTSGGHTEDNENIWGGSAIPYIRGVDDPWDKYSPYHHWRLTYSANRLGAALGVGRLRRVTNVSHGASSRIVRATFRGTGGTRRLHGYMDLKPRLGLRDAPSVIKRLTSNASAARAAAAGVGSHGFARDLSGSIDPGPRGQLIVLQRKTGDGWKRAGSARLGRSGQYRLAVDRPGTYRVVSAGDAGPAVRVR